MQTRRFLLVLAGVLAMGVGLGGAFFGGVALGKTSEPAATNAASLTPPRASQVAPGAAGGGAQTGQGQFGAGQPGQRLFGGGQGGQGGDFASRFGAGAAQFGSGLAGTVEKVEGNQIYIATQQGTLVATISPETTVQKLAEVAVMDIRQGERVTVVGQRTEDGTVTARSIMVVPEGSDGFFQQDLRGTATSTGQ